MKLYHLTDLARATAIDSDGFTDEPGTYKQTGMDLDGVFFSARELDSNEDDPGAIVYAIDLDEARIAAYEIIEANAPHRSYSIPASLANGVSRERLSADRIRDVPVADRAHDPAYAQARADV